LPPPIPRGEYLGQDWAFKHGERRTAALLLQDQINSTSGLEATIAYGGDDPKSGLLQILSPASGGQSHAQLFMFPEQRSMSVSSEFRAYKRLHTDSFDGQFDLLVRLRSSSAHFGGGSSIDLGDQPFGSPPAQIDPPLFPPAETDRLSRVRQWGAG